MTMKNSEFVFDLQAFAVQTTVASSANDTTAAGTLESNATVGASNGSLTVSGGWSMVGTDSTIVTATYDDTDTNVPPTYSNWATDTSHTDTFTHYAFSNTDTSAGAVSVVTVAADTTTTATSGFTAPPAGLINDTVVGSPVTLTGGGSGDSNLVLNGIGTISGALNPTSSVVLSANTNALNMTGVYGSAVTIDPTVQSGNGVFNQNVNGAAVNANIAAGSTFTFTGNDARDAVTIAANNHATLNAIDTNQTWNLTGGRSVNYNKLWVSSGNASLAVTSAGTVGNYLAVTAEKNSAMVDVSVANGATDTVVINGTVLGGAGTVKAAVTDGDNGMTVRSGSAGNLSAGVASVGGVASLASGATAIITTSEGAGTAITSVSKLAAGGKWALGSSLTSATLGSDTVTFATGANTITAGADGTTVKALNFAGGNATLQATGAHDSVAVGGTSTLANWSFGSSAKAVFDTVGNASVSGESGVTVTLNDGAPKTLAAGENGANDTLVLAKSGTAALDSNGVVVSASNLLNNSTWLVRGGESPRTVSVDNTYTFENATENVYGALKTSSLSNANAASGTVSAIESLSGNVTVGHGSNAISGLNVMGTTWSVSNDSDAVVFSSAGNSASLSAVANSDLKVAASSDASVQVAFASGNTVRGIFNHVTVTAHDDESPFTVQLEASDTAAGVAGIADLYSAATISGDNHVVVNGTFDLQKVNASNAARANAMQFTLGSGDMTVNNVVDGDSYNGTGGRIFYDITSAAASGGTAAITINSATATISATTDSKISNAYVISDGVGDLAIETIAGVKLNDTISSVTDRNFTVIYNTSDTAISSDTTYTMLVNGAGISVKGNDLVSGNSTIGVNVDNSGAKPVVSLSSGVISNNATVTVGSGVYNVGGNTAVTVNDDVGFLYFASNGSVTAEDFSVAQERTKRENAVDNLLSANSDTTVRAFNDFYNAYYPNSNGYGFIGSTINSTVAGYASVTTATPTASAVTGGINIYGNASLNGAGNAGYPNSVTLQSYAPNAINVQHYEGLLSGQATLGNAVIDVSGSNNTLVAVGQEGSSFATNHTIIGSAKQSTLIVGSNATGDNVVRAGNGGNYIYHNAKSGSSAKVSIYGGTGADTIYASAGDHVEGGNGRDFFYDSSAIEISDYNFDDGDVIVATKLSASTPLTPENIQFSGNRVSIAAGAEITVGSSANYDEATATRAVIANASNDTTSTKFAIWAGNYESSLDASNFTKSAYMFSQMNEGRADTLVGSAFADSIYAGGNDYVDGGAGSDFIALSVGSGQNGATVVLSEGGDVVTGWKTGFDNGSGSNILAGVEANALNFRTRNDQIIAYSGSSSITFSDLSVSSSANFLVGSQKVTFIKNGQVATLSSNDDLGDYYKAERAGGISVGSGVTTEFTVSLGSDNFSSVNSLDLNNESKATIYGSNANETIRVSGSNENGARKYVAAGGGNDTIFSGGNNDTTAGNFFYFGTYNGYTYASGKNDIYNFSFYKSNAADYSTSDLIYLGASSNYSSLSVNGSRAEIALKDDTKVIIHGASDSEFSNTDNKIVRIQFGDDDKIYNTKLGITGSSNNTFTYDGVTDLYLGNTARGRDTLNVASDLSNVNIWLNDKNYDKNTYAGVNVINATLVADTKTTLAGNSESNVIVSGGNGTSNSLWGGGGQSNTLIGGNGEDTFFYFKAFGYTDNDGAFHSSSDRIDRVDSSDLIWLYDVTLDDIDANTTSIANNQITVGLKDGSNIVVTNMGQETNFKISNGQGGWQDVKAVSRGNNRYWE